MPPQVLKPGQHLVGGRSISAAQFFCTIELNSAAHFFCTIKLTTAVQVKPGEHVRVVGQPRVLGEWDTGRAPKLELVEPQSDLWAGTVEGLVTGAPFPFK